MRIFHLECGYLNTWVTKHWRGAVSFSCSPKQWAYDFSSRPNRGFDILATQVTPFWNHGGLQGAQGPSRACEPKGPPALHRACKEGAEHTGSREYVCPQMIRKGGFGASRQSAIAWPALDQGKKKKTLIFLRGLLYFLLL